MAHSFPHNLHVVLTIACIQCCILDNALILVGSPFVRLTGLNLPLNLIIYSALNFYCLMPRNMKGLRICLTCNLTNQLRLFPEQNRGDIQVRDRELDCSPHSKRCMSFMWTLVLSSKGGDRQGSRQKLCMPGFGTWRILYLECPNLLE